MYKRSAWLSAGLVLGLAACDEAAPPTEEIGTQSGPQQIANPASTNCVDRGGTLEIRTRGDGGEYGVCVFEDNRQCEEWAMMRGQCPVRGVKVTGYLTAAARYCAITGGTYRVTDTGGPDEEQGECALPDGRLCDAAANYNGTC